VGDIATAVSVRIPPHSPVYIFNREVYVELHISTVIYSFARSFFCFAITTAKNNTNPKGTIATAGNSGIEGVEGFIVGDGVTRGLGGIVGVGTEVGLGV
jgi:hypothetical protein